MTAPDSPVIFLQQLQGACRLPDNAGISPGRINPAPLQLDAKLSSMTFFMSALFPANGCV
jgi:hypothetical protein